MHSSLSRAVALAAVVLVAVPATAGAAVDEYAAEASTSSVRVSVLEEAVGFPLLDLVSTDAFASSDPTASASVGVIEVLGTELFSPAEASSDGEAVRDPGEGDGCQIPVAAPGLTLDAVCAVASADAGASDEAAANADTDLLQVNVNGSLLAALLTSSLSDFIATMTEGATADAINAFTQACNDLLGGEDVPEELPATVADLVAMSPVDLTAISDTVQEFDGNGPCSAILALTVEDVVPPSIPIEDIAATLDGVNLVDLSVDGAESDVTGDDAALTSTGTQAFVSLTGPGLDELDLPGIVSGLLTGLEDQVIAAIEVVTGEGTLDALPLDLSDEVGGIVDALPEFGPEPLIEATVSGGRATATLDNAGGTTTSGGEAPYVEVTIAPGVFALLGQEELATQRFEAGQSQVIAEGTPLESSISVGALSTQDDVEFGDTGLVGSTATASVTSVSLLNVPDAGSIEIDLALSEAGVYAASAVMPASAPPVEPLPHTGGGAAVAAVVALGAGLALRRRRD